MYRFRLTLAVGALVAFSLINANWALAEGVYIKQTVAEFRQWQDEMVESQQSRMVLRFEGGQVSDNLANAIRLFSEQMPKREVLVESGDTLCGILDRAYPEQGFVCNVEVANALAGWNEGVALEALQVGDVLRVPDLDLSTYNFSRLYYNDVPEQREALEREKDAWHSIYREESTLGSKERVIATRLVFTGYELSFPIESDPETLERVGDLTAMAGPNAYGFVVEQDLQQMAPEHSVRPSGLIQSCDELAAQTFEPNFQLEGMVGVAASAVDTAACRTTCVWQPDATGNGEVTPQGCSEIWLIDQTVLEKHSDFKFSRADGTVDANPAVCPKTAFDEQTHHATHLASIMVSRANNYGYVGVSPDSVLEYRSALTNANPTYIGWQAIIDEYSNDINANEAPVPRVLLFTSETRVFPQRDLDQGKLRSLRARLDHPFASEITNSFALVVVAVGQPDDPDLSGEEFSVYTPLLPQTLGNQRNVLVVTACENCASEDAKVWSKANFSYPQQFDDPGHSVNLVGVAAPGGDPLPAVVADDTVAAAAGTSQSAAFVAGLAAAMLNCYPDDFEQPMALKARILQTARPIKDAESRKRVATGVVDLRAAMLDPKQHWLKRSTGSEYEPVQITEWCIGGGIKLSDPVSGGQPDSWSITPHRLLRWMAVESVNFGGKEYMAYQRPDLNTSERPDSALKSIGPGAYTSAQNLVSLVDSNGASELLRISDVDDLILSHPVTASSSNACASDTN